MRNASLILCHVSLSWSIFTLGGIFVTEALTKKSCGRRNTGQRRPVCGQYMYPVPSGHWAATWDDEGVLVALNHLVDGSGSSP